MAKKEFKLVRAKLMVSKTAKQNDIEKLLKAVKGVDVIAVHMSGVKSIETPTKKGKK